jgi:hypothetical protein
VCRGLDGFPWNVCNARRDLNPWRLRFVSERRSGNNSLVTTRLYPDPTKSNATDTCTKLWLRLCKPNGREWQWWSGGGEEGGARRGWGVEEVMKRGEGAAVPSALETLRPSPAVHAEVHYILDARVDGVPISTTWYPLEGQPAVSFNFAPGEPAVLGVGE